MVKYTIRQAVKDDNRYCCQLTRQNMTDLFTRYWGGWKPAVFRVGFQIDATKIIVINNRRAGYYTLLFKPGHLYLDNIQISRPKQGKGIGTELLRTIISQSGDKPIQLTTFVDNPVISLYLRLGFEISSQTSGVVKMQRAETPVYSDKKKISSEPFGTNVENLNDTSEE